MPRPQNTVPAVACPAHNKNKKHWRLQPKSASAFAGAHQPEVARLCFFPRLEEDCDVRTCRACALSVDRANAARIWQSVLHSKRGRSTFDPNYPWRTHIRGCGDFQRVTAVRKLRSIKLIVPAHIWAARAAAESSAGVRLTHIWPVV